jgi:hypothetical protein
MMAKKSTKPSEATKLQITSPPSPNRQIQYVAASQVPTFYSNNVAIDLSSWDVRLRFGQIQGGDATVLNVGDVAHLFLSHNHARAFLKALGEALSKLDQLQQDHPANDDHTR